MMVLGHRPDPAPRRAPRARLHARRGLPQRHGQRRRRRRRLRLQRRSCRTARPGAYLASFTALAQLPDLWHRPGQGARVRSDRRHRRLLQGHERRRRAQGRRRRGERVRRHHVPAAVHRQLRPERDLPPDRPTEDGFDAMANLRSAVYQRPLHVPRHLGGQLAFYIGVVAATPRSITPLPARRSCGSWPRSPSARGALAVIGGTVGVILGMTFFTGAQVGLSGLRRARPARHRRVLRLRLRLLQHPRDRAAGRRHRAGGDGGLRLHRPARRDADLRGGRRPRGDGDPVDAVPGRHPRRRRPDRDHPALRGRPAVVLLRQPAGGHPVLRPVARAPTTTTSTSSCHQETCCGPSARCSSSP